MKLLILSLLLTLNPTEDFKNHCISIDYVIQEELTNDSTIYITFKPDVEYILYGDSIELYTPDTKLFKKGDVIPVLFKYSPVRLKIKYKCLIIFNKV